MAYVELTRPSAEYNNRLRSYNVYIDGALQADKLTRSEPLRLSVSPGTHSLSVAVDWCRTRPSTFEATAGSPLRFSVGARAAWRAVFKPKTYLEVLPLEGDEAMSKPAAKEL